MERKSNPKAIISLVLGIVSVVLIPLIYYGIIEFYFIGAGVAAGIVGIVLGIKAKKTAPSGMAVAGIVLSIIGLAVCAFFFISCAICVGTIAIASMQ
jgi:hypothetical protein